VHVLAQLLKLAAVTCLGGFQLLGELGGMPARRGELLLVAWLLRRELLAR
jgi:hypothetical protein